MKPTKIVITGGLGFIGLALARELVALAHEVILIDNLSAQIHGDLPIVSAPSGAKVVRIDISEIAQNYELFEGVDAVFHLAAETGTAQSMYQMSRYARVNCEGTTALLEAIAKCNRRPKRIVLASSRSVYGEGAYTYSDEPGSIVVARSRKREDLEKGNWDPVDESGRSLTAVPTPESFPYIPGSVYAATKAAQELLLLSSCISLGLHTTVFRFQNVFGEGQSLRNPYTGIISIFFNRARQGLHIPVYEDGRESRDFVHVSDVVSALKASLEADLPSGVTMNVGAGVPTSVMTLAETLLSASGLSVPVKVTNQYRVGDIRHCCADLALARKYLGFSPRISLRQGLERFCEWAVTQPPYEDKSPKAEAELKARGLTN